MILKDIQTWRSDKFAARCCEIPAQRGPFRFQLTRCQCRVACLMVLGFTWTVLRIPFLVALNIWGLRKIVTPKREHNLEKRPHSGHNLSLILEILGLRLHFGINRRRLLLLSTQRCHSVSGFERSTELHSTTPPPPPPPPQSTRFFVSSDTANPPRLRNLGASSIHLCSAAGLLSVAEEIFHPWTMTQGGCSGFVGIVLEFSTRLCLITRATHYLGRPRLSLHVARHARHSTQSLAPDLHRTQRLLGGLTNRNWFRCPALANALQITRSRCFWSFKGGKSWEMRLEG